MTSPIGKARYRAPAANGEVLSVPPREQLLSLVEANRLRTEQSPIEILGHPLAKVGRSARQEVFQAATEYTRSYADVERPWSNDAPIIATGHQPEMFHPGVWLKNFAAASLAERANGIALHLIVDSDLCRAPSIKVPTGSVESPQVTLILYDIAAREMPFEERRIINPSLWDRFAETVASTIAPLVDRPMIQSWWPQAVARSRDLDSLGYCVAQARHQTELAWGNTTLEVPQSAVCRTGAFRRFALHLLLHAEQFQGAYNSALAEYRRVHKLRNRAQPVPNLVQSSGWWETPFWTWSAADPIRKPLFTRFESGRLLLTDRADWQAVLEISENDDLQNALAQLEAWEASGRKLRTRALTTTMFVRLLIADGFIHGIGGAKYDEVTDAICANFFGQAPAPYTMVSGTLRLPIAHPEVPPERDRQLGQQLRELRFHPEKFIDQVPLEGENHQAVHSLVAEKQGWIHTTKTPQNASQRHEGIERVNEKLQPVIAPVREASETQLQQVQRLTRNNRLLESREFSFCLFPEEELRKFLLDF